MRDEFEEIKSILKELAERDKEWEKRQSEWEKRQKEWEERRHKELEERQKEWEERQREWEEKREREWEKSRKEREERQKEWGERQREWEERQKKRDMELEKTRKMVANLTDGWGRFTEGLIIPSLDNILVSFGMNVKATYQRAKKRRGDEEMEIDILEIAEKEGKEIIITVEAKTYLKRDDVNDFINTMERFQYFFDEYKNKEVIGFVAFMNCEKGVAEYAENKGLYVLAPSDDIMVILNKKDFKPRVFKF